MDGQWIPPSRRSHALASRSSRPEHYRDPETGSVPGIVEGYSSRPGIPDPPNFHGHAHPPRGSAMGREVWLSAKNSSENGHLTDEDDPVHFDPEFRGIGDFDRPYSRSTSRMSADFPGSYESARKWDMNADSLHGRPITPAFASYGGLQAPVGPQVREPAVDLSHREYQEYPGTSDEQGGTAIWPGGLVHRPSKYRQALPSLFVDF